MRLPEKDNIRRLVIYFFYDENGIVDRYIPYLLQDMRRNCTELCVVCNGLLSDEGREILSPLADRILVRENVGFDVWAYKHALDHYGWEVLSSFDELVLMNFTIMGPVYPFSEMFAEMDARDLDFWGITKYPRVDSNPYGTKYGYLPAHVQSHFIAVRSSMFNREEFQTYWRDIPPIRSYADAVGKHEAIFTKNFADLGFRWSVYADIDPDGLYSYSSVMFQPVEMLRDARCPIFKRRTFFHPVLDIYSFSCETHARELMDYLKRETDYDTDLIYENLLRTCHMSLLKESLVLDYILPQNRRTVPPHSHGATALVLHLYYEDQIEACYRYALSMPQDCDVIITTDSEQKKLRLEEVFRNGPWQSVRILLIQNRGRDVSALLVAAAPLLAPYEYVCFVHDKKATQLSWGLTGAAFSERCFANLLASRDYVENILSLFEKEPRLGLLMPPPPNHGTYYCTLGVEWSSNYENTLALYHSLGLQVPIAPDREPISPLGTMFWFRPAALKKLLDRGWDYADFPPEPNGEDGTLLHAIERLYGFVAQDAGYYSAWVLTEEYARDELTKLSFELREVNARTFQAYGLNYLYGICSVMDFYIKRGPLRDGPAALTTTVRRKLSAKLKPIFTAFRQKLKRFVPKSIRTLYWTVRSFLSADRKQNNP